ncbi:histone H1.2 isoform X1 [Myotis daubentonii]|uniref:histone H1.2 isoform X1 n=1 Tax=Myotis daubentonii TaxID=98922 RepID=UPI002872D911|nr:histone H1.2 isoform X1 [Myotis daubentonii]
MSETAPAAPAAAPPAEKTPVKKKAAKKPSGVRRKASGPPVSELITKAVAASKERSGVSLAALKKALAAAGYDVDKNNSRIKLGLKSLVSKGTLLQTKGTGASGSFKISKKAASGEAKPKAKKAGAAKPRKPAGAAKKPKKAAGSATPKKSAKKTPKKPKKAAAAAAAAGAKKAAKSPKKAKAAKPKKSAKSPGKAVKSKAAKPKVAKAKKAAPKKNQELAYLVVLAVASYADTKVQRKNQALPPGPDKQQNQPWLTLGPAAMNNAPLLWCLPIHQCRPQP